MWRCGAKKAAVQTLVTDVQQLKRQLDDVLNENQTDWNGEADAETNASAAANRIQCEIYRKLVLFQVTSLSNSGGVFRWNFNRWRGRRRRCRSLEEELLASGVAGEDLVNELLRIISCKGRAARYAGTLQDLDLVLEVAQIKQLIKSCRMPRARYEYLLQEDRSFFDDFPTSSICLQDVQLNERVHLSSSNLINSRTELSSSGPKRMDIVVDFVLCPELLEEQLSVVRKLRRSGVSIAKCTFFRTSNLFLEDRLSKLRDYQRTAIFNRMYGYLCQFLKEMPDVECLRFAERQSEIGNDFKVEDLQYLARLQNKRVYRLPELFDLHHLDVCDLDQWLYLVVPKMLQKYGPQLETVILLPGEWYSWRKGGRVAPHVLASQLTALKIDYSLSLASGCLREFGRQSLFVNCQLRHLYLEVSLIWRDDGGNKVTFAEVMLGLNSFAQTLETLQLCLNRELQFWDNFYESGDPSWIAKLSLPNLRLFDIKGYPGEWTFLLQLANLEKLIISNFPLNCASEEDYFPSGGVPELTWSTEKMCNSNLWELLPVLEELYLERWEDGSGELQGCFRITRNMVEKVRELGAQAQPCMNN